MIGSTTLMIKAIPYIATFAGSLGFTVILTPVVERLAVRCKCIDAPDARKVHCAPTPRWGGIAIAVSVILSTVLALILFEDMRIFISSRLHEGLQGLLIGGILITILGMLDDRFNLPAKLKLLGQIAIAIIMIKFGIVITFFTVPFIGFIYLPVWFSWTISLLWIVGITNAINLMDGLDGLLAGVSAIFALLFFIVALLKGQFLIALLMMALAGASLGFLRFNFNPARIFMGDTGSLFLGLMYASLSIMGAFKVTTTAAMFIPMLILGIPIFDTSFAIFRRFMGGRPIFQPDKEHVHHQLLARGLTVRQAVIYIYALSGILGGIGLSLALIIR